MTLRAAFADFIYFLKEYHGENKGFSPAACREEGRSIAADHAARETLAIPHDYAECHYFWLALQEAIDDWDKKPFKTYRKFAQGISKPEGLEGSPG